VLDLDLTNPSPWELGNWYLRLERMSCISVPFASIMPLIATGILALSNPKMERILNRRKFIYLLAGIAAVGGCAGTVDYALENFNEQTATDFDKFKHGMILNYRNAIITSKAHQFARKVNEVTDRRPRISIFYGMYHELGMKGYLENVDELRRQLKNYQNDPRLGLFESKDFFTYRFSPEHDKWDITYSQLDPRGII
jgi:hypothetical protein